MAESRVSRQRVDNGHLAVRVEGLHAPQLVFSFEHRQSKVGVGSALGAHAIFILIAVAIALYAPTPDIGGPPPRTELPKEIVWLSEAGPGGGGGGGGNQSPEPPKKAEVPAKDKISVPVERPPAPKPQPKLDEPKEPLLNIPAKTLGDAQVMNPGLLEGVSTVALSQGTGSGGGAGTGEGTGIGPGKGSGLGPGEGGGTGGNAYRPGNGVELPQPIRQVRPNYTADAMRAKVQGTVWVECVVNPDGSVGDVSVTKSLDSVFGLDQEAVKAAKQWRFVPGRRFGQPVPVLVTIELTFTLR